MIQLHLHFHGGGSKRCRFSSLPPVGDYLVDAAGKLHMVTATVFTGGKINVYAIPVADDLAAKLRVEWATWHNATKAEGAVAEATGADGQGGE